MIVVHLQTQKEYMEDVVIPYELPEPENHSFFFIDQCIDTRLEAKLHRHDALPACTIIGTTTQHRQTKGDASVI